MPGEHGNENKLIRTVTIAVTVGLDGDREYVVSDEGGEFARATTVELALPYVRDLLYGPGTTALLSVGAIEEGRHSDG